MKEITISLDDDELARIRALAQARGLSVEDWARETITQVPAAWPAQPHDPLFGVYADEPALIDAIDEVVTQRHQTSLRAP